MLHQQPDNVHTDGNGYLVISANKESGNCADGWYRYITSARLTTKGLTAGSTPASRSAPRCPPASAPGRRSGRSVRSQGIEWPEVGEIDAMEYVGRDRAHVIGTVHGADRGR